MFWTANQLTILDSPNGGETIVKCHQFFFEYNDYFPKIMILQEKCFVSLSIHKFAAFLSVYFFQSFFFLLFVRMEKQCFLSWMRDPMNKHCSPKNNSFTLGFLRQLFHSETRNQFQITQVGSCGHKHLRHGFENISFIWQQQVFNYCQNPQNLYHKSFLKRNPRFFWCCESHLRWARCTTSEHSSF